MRGCAGRPVGRVALQVVGRAGGGVAGAGAVKGVAGLGPVMGYGSHGAMLLFNWRRLAVS